MTGRVINKTHQNNANPNAWQKSAEKIKPCRVTLISLTQVGLFGIRLGSSQ